MNKFQIVSAAEAVLDIKDGDTVVFGGAGAGHAVPDKVMEHLEHDSKKQDNQLA